MGCSVTSTKSTLGMTSIDSRKLGDLGKLLLPVVSFQVFWDLHMGWRWLYQTHPPPQSENIPASRNCCFSSLWDKCPNLQLSHFLWRYPQASPASCSCVPHLPGISHFVPSAWLWWSLYHPSSKILHYLINCEGNKILSQRAENPKKWSLIQPSQRLFLLLDQEMADPGGSFQHPTALRALSSSTQRWLFQQDQEHFSWDNIPIPSGYPSQPHLAAERMQRELPLEKPQGKHQNLWKSIKCWDVIQLPGWRELLLP